MGDEESIEVGRDQSIRFTMVQNAVIEDERVTLYDLAVYTALSSYADNGTRNCTVRIKTLAARARCGATSVKQSLKNLQAYGYLTVRGRCTEDAKQRLANAYAIPWIVRPVEGGGSWGDRGGGSWGDQQELDSLSSRTIQEKGSSYLDSLESAPADEHRTETSGTTDHADSPKPEKATGADRKAALHTFFKSLEDVALVYRDVPLVLTDTEKRDAGILMDKYGESEVVKVWSDYLHDKPGKPFRFFVEDAASRLRVPDPEPEPEVPSCEDCGRATYSREEWTDEEGERFLCSHCFAERCRSADPDGSKAAAAFAEMRARVAVPA